MTPRAMVLGGAVALWLASVALTGWQAYRRGYGDSEAAHAAQMLARIEAGQKLDAARRQVALERDALARKLEREAHADPVVVERCLGPDRLRRLNAIR